ncbi:hypothetical protein RB195_020134 [Necator americanus]|uniref:Uncharacterized protein n=1 Tax=Necator americanus TaxID=51031 RepID=A0ABR1CJJ6_NECAM
MMLLESLARREAAEQPRSGQMEVLLEPARTNQQKTNRNTMSGVDPQSLMFYPAWWLVDKRAFCFVCWAVLSFIRGVQTQWKPIEVQVLDEQNKLVLKLNMYTNEKLSTLYTILVRTVMFICATYEGFNLDGDYSFEDYKIKTKVAKFKITDSCGWPWTPLEYIHEKYKVEGTTNLPSGSEDTSEAYFAQIVFWIVLVILAIAIALLVTYYLYLTKRRRQIQKEKKDLRKGKTVTSTVSTTRTAGNVAPSSPKVTDVIIVNPEIPRIEGEEEVQNTSASTTEVREVK